jgi:hypothetical protein
VEDVARIAAFYQQHFGMKQLQGNDGWVEMLSTLAIKASG